MMLSSDMECVVEDLTKWPRLLVVGDSVTESQAEEIIIRTNDWYLCVNDRYFERAVYRAAGIAIHDQSLNVPDQQSMHAFNDRHHVVHSLNYLCNHRIASSWIGGPHGWVDWDGTVGCSEYNIGKWPDRQQVGNEWAHIAHAFPFLNLRAQLIPNEGDHPVPAVEYRIHDGFVETVDNPDEWIASIDEEASKQRMTAIYNKIFTNYNGDKSWEHGASIERITLALENNLRSVNSK